MNRKKKKIAVALSGGVDSSTTAYLLKRQGFEVVGLHMRLQKGGEETERAIRAICKKLKIQYYPVNLSGKFREKIIKYFLSSYENGLTPNPCVLCNKEIKFKELLRITSELGCDYLATGHYAIKSKVESPKSKVQSRKSKVESPKSKVIYKILKSKDSEKDQTYFLYKLTQKELEKILFPLGEMTKDEVRKIANKAKLPYIKKESQDVCFLNQNGKIIEHNDYLKRHLKLKRGLIKTLDNKIISEHQGLPLYTIGQRRGIEIGGTGPYYAAKMDLKNNILYVTNKFDDKVLYKNELTAKEINWISGMEPNLLYKCEAVIRYRHKPVKCKVHKVESRKSKVESYRVIFNEPQRAITPGQSIVFYKENEMIGGGIIN